MRDQPTELKVEVLRVAHWIASNQSEKLGIQAMRIAIAIIFLWIGALKFVPYEADSITPFVANNPIMRLFYKHPEEYKAHLTREGQFVPAEREWQANNNTYAFSQGLGIVEVIIGLLTLAGLVSPRYGLAGATMSFLTPVVTLSFLFTTPEAWVPDLGDAEFGFPYLSGAGRLVIKDVALFAGSWLVMVDCVRDLLQKRAVQSAVAMLHTAHRGGPRL
ncbi:reactive chlorine resistance membrane protein RclC [Bradyrhizobium sp. 151]|uniref:reactive chlorine resistance membrane protein RclC n=1 Tax=Bradyrhizobium sp. 151 TaxID=2782626 RepID=UPI0021138C04|nr:reactive chlorine resistance membrane protein RclC [Bradyrhizobium sp. 151]MCK1656098.1 YkgB family protein [Bradyrhizobium sp. 151]